MQHKEKYSFKRRKEAREAGDGQRSAARLAAGKEGPKGKERAAGKVHRASRIKNNKTPQQGPASEQQQQQQHSTFWGSPPSPAHCCLFRFGQQQPPGSSAKQRIKEREREKASPFFSPPAPPPGCPQPWGGRSNTRDGQRRLPSLARSPRSPGSRSIPERRGRPGGQARGRSPHPRARRARVHCKQAPGTEPLQRPQPVSGGGPRNSHARSHPRTHARTHTLPHTCRDRRIFTLAVDYCGVVGG